MKWKKTANPRNPQICLYSCKFSYLECVRDYNNKFEKNLNWMKLMQYLN